ncbi:MAG: cytochrome c [Saprospiraceae bacterium]|nr:cytochrome c [Saprospiraceae bacterium]
MRLQEFQRLYFLRVFNCFPLCYVLYFLLFLALALGACTEQGKMGEQLKQVAEKTLSEQKFAQFDLEFLLGEEHDLEAVEVLVKYDHTLKHEQKYKAYPFSKVFASLLAQGDYDWIQASDPSKILITYKCVDGYNASTTLDVALSQESYIAFTDLNSETEAWTGRMASKMPPFYLVWEEVPYDDHSLLWPYGLSKLTLTPYEAAYASIMPKENLEGFKLYETHCLKCHSLNKIGGVMGPEFNYPRNILSYWEADNMWAFLNDPKSFRYNSKMPPITYLERAQFDEIVKYLRELDQMPRDPS